MKRKNASAHVLCFAAVFLCFLFCLYAGAKADVLQIMDYSGGVIERGSSSAAAFFSLDDELNIAYVSPQNGELTAGEVSVWEVSAEGGTEPYTFEYSLYYKSFSDSSNKYQLVQGSTQKTEEPTFSMVTPEEGWYILLFTITDANGDYVKFQSARFATASPEVRQTVARIVEECLNDDMGDYEKAVALHDYLCETAEYDALNGIHEPDGVLLQGKGVCESFALAYQMLLGKAGIENMYVEGRGGFDAHAWNLVKLDGEWYHVDVTWDEDRTDRYYFGMNDALLKRSHTITSRVPAATGTKYNPAMQASDDVLSSVNELLDLFRKMPEEQKTFRFYYTGKGSVASQFLEWQKKYRDVVSFEACGVEGNNWHTMYVYGTIQEIREGRKIRAEAFSGLDIQKVFLTREYYEIGELAFANCKSLKEIHIPIAVCSIAANAFEGCEQLTIYAPKGSEAAAYAASHGIPWVEEQMENE